MVKRAFAFIGASGSGKTTLIIRLIDRLKARGFRVGAVKHSHCNFGIDYENKDSYRMKEAGAESVVISSNRRLALVSETREETPLKKILSEYFEGFDIVLVEGFHESEVPKILVESWESPYLGRLERVQDQLIAVVTDSVEGQKGLPGVRLFSRDQIAPIADYLAADLQSVLDATGVPTKCSALPQTSRVEGNSILHCPVDTDCELGRGAGRT